MRKITTKWLKQAEADLNAAKDSLAGRHYEWSCFQSQQSGEKALKAFLYEKEDAEKCINSAESILNAVKSLFRK